MNRSQRTLLARQTVEIVEKGYYDNAEGRVDISATLKQCLSETRQFTADELSQRRDQVLASSAQFSQTQIEVVNETTLSGLQSLTEQSDAPVAVLNFASAKNPGGGFLGGSEAQEESLARSSALYASLCQEFSFYERHRNLSSCLYTDAMILSPSCPVIRDDSGNLRTTPLLASFITSPAPNAGALADKRSSELSQVTSTLIRRSELVLALAASRGYSRVILGAWGCGVFRNDPVEVAQVFANHLKGPWSGRFEQVRFSVLDRSEAGHTFAAFQQAFA